MKITVRPSAFPCSLAACPPGLFLCGTTLGFKSEYRTSVGGMEAYIIESGEFFWGGSDNEAERARLVVTPCEVLIEIAN